MHARVVTAQVKPGKMDEVLEIAKGSIFAAMKQQRGFKEWVLLTDRNTGKLVSIPMWETEVDMMASEASGYLQEQFGKIMHLLTAPPVTERFEVSFKAGADT